MTSRDALAGMTPGLVIRADWSRYGAGTSRADGPGRCRPLTAHTYGRVIAARRAPAAQAPAASSRGRSGSGQPRAHALASWGLSGAFRPGAAPLSADARA